MRKTMLLTVVALTALSGFSKSPAASVFAEDGALRLTLDGVEWTCGDKFANLPEFAGHMNLSGSIVPLQSGENRQRQEISPMYHSAARWAFRRVAETKPGKILRVYDVYDSCPPGIPATWRLTTAASVTRDGEDLVLERRGRRVRLRRMSPRVCETDWRVVSENGVRRIEIPSVTHRSGRTEFAVELVAATEPVLPAEPKLGPRTTEAEFFDHCLLLSIPEMAAAHEAAAAGDFPLARRRFAAYVRKTLRSLSPPKREALSADQQDLLTRDLIDWEANGDYTNLEYPVQRNRHGLLSMLAGHYVATGEAKAAEQWQRQFTHWAEAEMVPRDLPYGATIAWRSVDTGLRASGMLQNFRAFIDSPVMTDEFVTLYFRSVRENGWRLRHWCSWGNWLISELKGLVTLAVDAPFLAEAAEWKEFALRRIDREFAEQVGPDGFHYELTTHYHKIAESEFFIIIQFLKQRGIEPPANLLKGMEKMYEAYIKLTRPDRKLPDLNDGAEEGIKWRLWHGLQLYPERTDFRWFIDPPSNAGGEMPKYTSTALENMGAVAMRSDWSPNAVWGYMDCGPLGRGHEHEDFLNVLLFAYGKSMLTEGGNSDYDSSAMRRYVISSHSHNVLLVDGKAQNRRDQAADIRRPHTEAAPFKFVTTPAVDWASAVYTNNYGNHLEVRARHSRKLVFHKQLENLPPFFVVIDRVGDPDPKSTHTYDLLWHLETCKLKMGERDFVGNFGDGKGLAVFCSDREAKVKNCEGSMKPYQGWKPIRGAKDGHHRPIPTPIVTGPFQGSKRIVSVLCPFDGKCPIAGVEASESTQAGEYAIILRDGRRIELNERELPRSSVMPGKAQTVAPLVPYPNSVKLGEKRVKLDAATIDAAVRDYEKDPRLPTEGYRFQVKKSGVTVFAADAAGAFYAGRTLRQYLATAENGEVAELAVEDAPKFKWRGLHLDDARHFLGKTALLKTLETMANFKMNVLHWHLVDNEGWRLPIPGYPSLTNGVRKVENRRNFRDQAPDGEYGPFAYTSEEVEEIVAKARSLHIRIVPELEIPGHSRMLLKSCPQFACSVTGGVRKVDDVACVGKDATLRFFEAALDEVMRLFPGEVIHIGGDECNRRGWQACEDCQARMAACGLKSAAELQSWTTAHFERYLARHGRRLMGWDEIAEGGLPPGAMVMSWRGAQTGIVAAQHGHEVVMTPTEYCYLDYPQGLANDPGRYPFNWTVIVPLAKTYGLDPLKGIPEKYHRFVLGAQGNNWSEMTCTRAELEWKLWPRGAALAEVLWSYPKVRDFDDFANRLQSCRRLERDRGINMAPVRLHAEPGKAAGTLRRKALRGGGEVLEYACGATQATLRFEKGKFSLTTEKGTRNFKGQFAELAVEDMGVGALLVTARPRDTDFIVTVLLDGERVLAKERWDYREEDPPLPDELRPYEFVWANRRADEFPPVERLERAEGWSVVVSNAEARFETATNRALFGRSVTRLTYRGTGENPSIRLQPPRPLALPDGFDTLSLWAYGNNIRGREFPAVGITAEFVDASGRKFTRPLGSVAHKEWHLLIGVSPETVPYGAKLTAFIVNGGTNQEFTSIDLTSFCAYIDPKRPIEVKPLGELPFPTRPETVIPKPAKLTKKLEFRFPKNSQDWSDLAFRYGDSEWILLAKGGGLFPQDRALDAKVKFRQTGNSLVCEVETPEPGVNRVELGVVQFPETPLLYGWPYYTYRYFNQWDNPILRNTECGLSPCYFRPKVAVTRVGGKTLFVGATFDWMYSNASGPYCVPRGEKGDAQLSTGMIYLPKTDKTLNPVRERFVWTFAEKLEDVFPEIPNPASPYRQITGSNSWAVHGAGNRARDAERWRAIKAAGIAHVVINDHETEWRDGNESFTLRIHTAPKKGGDEGQRKYADTLIGELGYYYGPYNNFTDYAPVNGYWSIDNAGRLPNGTLNPGWNRCYTPKPNWGVEMCEYLAPILKSKYGFNTAYCDVHTCVTPWQRVDYDSRSPGAGTFRRTFFDFGKIMLLQKAAWRGPVYSEGSIQWLYSGLTDGNYAQDEEYDFMKKPWLVDFDLRRMHPLCCNFGMGAPYMFYHGENAKIRKENAQLWMDRFTAATLAFGHPGFLVGGGKADDFEIEKESYYPVQAIAAKYTQAEVRSIYYAGESGKLYESTAAYANGAVSRSQIKVVYSDGTIVAVNGNLNDDFKVEVAGKVYELPPNGWRAESADRAIVSFNGMENGKRVKYACSPEYEWRKEL